MYKCIQALKDVYLALIDRALGYVYHAKTKGDAKMAELWDILDKNGNKTGRLHERGKPMQKDDYHLIVNIWIINSKGEFLVSKRSEKSGRGGKWHTTGGCAVAGDDSLTAALREVKEEIGITLDPKNGQFFKRVSAQHVNGKGAYFADVWLFRQEVDISSVTLQVEEVCDVMWASEAEIKQMKKIDKWAFDYEYLGELFCLYKHHGTSV